MFSGASLDNKTRLPSIEPSQEECQTIHSLVRDNFQSLVQYHCPKVLLLEFCQCLRNFEIYSFPKIHQNY